MKYKCKKGRIIVSKKNNYSVLQKSDKDESQKIMNKLSMNKARLWTIKEIIIHI